MVDDLRRLAVAGVGFVTEPGEAFLDVQRTGRVAHNVKDAGGFGLCHEDLRDAAGFHAAPQPAVARRAVRVHNDVPDFTGIP